MENDEMADCYAACFLMPEDEYRKVFEENLVNNGQAVRTDKIAAYFHVTITDAALRGVELGLIKAW